MNAHLTGIQVVVTPDLPRYTMPEWLLPPSNQHDGVRWDQALRQETDRWALDFLGTTNVTMDGEVLMVDPRRVGIPGRPTAYMNPRTWSEFKRKVVTEKGQP